MKLAVLTLLTATMIGSAWYSIPILKPFPKPTGPFHIGIQTFDWIDQKRNNESYMESPQDKRHVIAHVWYPADDVMHLQKAPYLDNKMPIMQTFFAQKYGIPQWLSTLLLSNITTNAYLNAPLSKKHPNYPIVLFSHGAHGEPSDMYISIIENLVSHGYIVVGIDHPYLNLLTLYDGKIISSQPLADRFERLSPTEQKEYLTKTIDIYKADMQFVLNQLGVLDKEKQSTFFDHFDFSRVGIMGHSAGGTAAIELARIDKRIKACIDLDGWYDHIISTKPLPVPLLLMFAQESITITEPTADYLKRKQENREQYFDRMHAIAKHQKELCQNTVNCQTVIVPEADHGSFGDLVLFKWPLRAWHEPNAYKILSFINEHILKFFNTYLEKKYTLFIQGYLNNPLFSKIQQQLTPLINTIIKEELNLASDFDFNFLLPKEKQRLTLYTVNDFVAKEQNSIDIEHILTKEKITLTDVTLSPHIQFFGDNKDELVIMVDDSKKELSVLNQKIKTIMHQLNDEYQHKHNTNMYDISHSERFPYTPHLGIGRIRTTSIKQQIKNPIDIEKIYNRITQRIIDESTQIIQKIWNAKETKITFTSVGIFSPETRSYIKEYSLI